MCIRDRRLTALTGALLFLLLGLIGITILSVRSLLPQHMLLGFVLIPPVALKLASAGYRFTRYYLRDPPYRKAGPPPLSLRLLAPVVVVTTVVLFVTGLELWLFGLRFGSVWIAAHRLSFFVWLPAIALHVLGHLNRTMDVVAQELTSPGSDFFARRSLVVGSLVAGAILGAASLTYASPFIFFGEG